jgi:hypothetical protein
MIPYKIWKYLKILRYFVLIYINDRRSFKTQVEMLTKRGKFANYNIERTREFLTTEIVIEEEDGIKYNSSYISKSICEPSFFVEHTNDKVGASSFIVQMLERYLNYHYLCKPLKFNNG